MNEEAAWALWICGAFLLSCAWCFAAVESPSRWLKTIIAVWCLWTLPPFVAAWLRLMLS